MSYIHSLIFTIIDNTIERNIKKYIKDTILIDITDIHALEFNLNYNTKCEIRKVGYKTAKHYMKKRAIRYYKHKLLQRYFTKLRPISC